MTLASADFVRRFLEQGPWAVVGASRDREKFGNRVLRRYQQRGMEVYPVNPSGGSIEGLQAYADLASLPRPVQGISVITPPAVTLRVVDQAAAAGIAMVWLQPGAESEAVRQRAREHGLELLADGSCFLVHAPA